MSSAVSRSSRPYWLLGILSLLLIYAVYLRAVYFRSDLLFELKLMIEPAPGDEGWLQSGRLYALFGHLLPEDWMHTYVIAPFPNLLCYILVKCFGSHYAIMRSPSCILGIASIVGLMAIGFRYFDKKVALFAALFSVVNVVLVAYSRGGFLESYLIPCQILMIALLFHCILETRGYFWIGFLSVIAMGIKSSSVLSTVPLTLLCLATSFMHEEKGPLLRKRWLVGVLTVAIPYAVFVAFNFKRWFRLFFGYALGRTFIRGDHWGELMGLPSGTAFVGPFAVMPYLYLATGAVALAFLWDWPAGTLVPPVRSLISLKEIKDYQTRLLAEFKTRGRLGRLDFILFWVFTGELGFHLLLGSESTARRASHLIVPAIILASRGLQWLMDRPRSGRSQESGIWAGSTLFVGSLIAWFCTKAFVFAFLRNAEVPIHVFPFTIQTFATLMSRDHVVRAGLFEMAFFPLWAIVLWGCHHLKGRMRWPGSRVVSGIGFLLIVCSFVSDNKLVLPVLRHPSYFYLNASKKLEELAGKPKSVILGYFGGGTQWEATFYPLVYYPGIGIGYKGITIPQIPSIIQERSIQYLIVNDEDGRPRTISSDQFDWSKYKFSTMTSYEEQKKISPIIMEFNKIVYTWPALGNPEKAECVVLTRR